MKYSVPNRAAMKYLKQADEIKIQKSDQRKTIDYIEDYPEATIVLCVGNLYEEIDTKDLLMWKEKANGRLILEVENILSPNMKEVTGIPFYWKYPVTTFDELQALKSLGACQVLIDGPLFFQMREVKSYGMKVRVIPNVCYEGYLPRINGLHGTWMRPQDQDLYEQYVDMLEFKEDNMTKWEALFDIYSKDKTFFGDLNVLFKNFDINTPVLAAAVPREVIKSRLTCGQRCTRNRCHLCESGLMTGLHVQQEEALRFKEQL